jgi:hypothetical protein
LFTVSDSASFQLGNIEMQLEHAPHQLLALFIGRRQHVPPVHLEDMLVGFVSKPLRLGRGRQSGQAAKDEVDRVSGEGRGDVTERPF